MTVVRDWDSGVPGGLAHEASLDDEDPSGILFQLVIDKQVAASEKIAAAEALERETTEIEAVKKAAAEALAAAHDEALAAQTTILALPTLTYEELTLENMRGFPLV